MLECIDAIHLTVAAGRRAAAESGPPFTAAMRIWDSAFRAADVMVSDPVGAMRVILESCRTLSGTLSAILASGP